MLPEHAVQAAVDVGRDIAVEAAGRPTGFDFLAPQTDLRVIGGFSRLPQQEVVRVEFSARVVSPAGRKGISRVK